MGGRERTERMRKFLYDEVESARMPGVRERGNLTCPATLANDPKLRYSGLREEKGIVSKGRSREGRKETKSAPVDGEEGL